MTRVSMPPSVSTGRRAAARSGRPVTPARSAAVRAVARAVHPLGHAELHRRRRGAVEAHVPANHGAGNDRPLPALEGANGLARDLLGADLPGYRRQVTGL